MKLGQKEKSQELLQDAQLDKAADLLFSGKGSPTRHHIPNISQFGFQDGSSKWCLKERRTPE